MTLDIEKAFDSVNYLFLITALEKYGFIEDFIKCLKIIIQYQESCVINRGTTTNYFKLERGNRQGDLISAYLFILVLETAFLFIMQNEKINGLIIFENSFLYTAYVDDTTFFLKDEKSVIQLTKAFDIFLTFSGLKPNKSKCEIAGLGVLKGVKLALCGMECINLMFNVVKILGLYYLFDKNFENKENFINLVPKIEKLLRIWRMRNLSIADKITGVVKMEW